MLSGLPSRVACSHFHRPGSVSLMCGKPNSFDMLPAKLLSRSLYLWPFMIQEGTPRTKTLLPLSSPSSFVRDSDSLHSWQWRSLQVSDNHIWFYDISGVLLLFIEPPTSRSDCKHLGNTHHSLKRSFAFPGSQCVAVPQLSLAFPTAKSVLVMPGCEEAKL